MQLQVSKRWKIAGVSLAVMAFLASATFLYLNHQTESVKAFRVSLVTLTTGTEEGVNLLEYRSLLRDARTKFELSRGDLHLGREAVCDDALHKAELALDVWNQSTQDEVSTSVWGELRQLGAQMPKSKDQADRIAYANNRQFNPNETSEMNAIRSKRAGLVRSFLRDNAVAAALPALEKAVKKLD